MSTYGTIQDMVRRIKVNEAHRKALQEHRRNLRKSYANTLKSQNPSFKKHDISEEDLEVLKAKIRADIRKERKAKPPQNSHFRYRDSCCIGVFNLFIFVQPIPAWATEMGKCFLVILARKYIAP